MIAFGRLSPGFALQARAYAYDARPPFTTYSSTCSINAVLQMHHFTGKEHDFESGNGYFSARYYASSTGRFLSPDPGWPLAIDPSNPQSLNLYSYALNNPSKLVDPSGMILCNYGPTQDSADYEDAESADECTNNGGSLVVDKESVTATATATSAPSLTPSSSGTSTIPNTPNTPNKYCLAPGYGNARNFVATNQTAATQVANSLNTAPGNLLGLSGFESGWGTGPLISAGTNNYFSLKAGPAFATGATGQFTLGSNTFWTYSSFLGSAQAFANSYFGTRVNGITDPVAFAQAMNSGGKFNSEQRSVPYNTTLVNAITIANGVLQCP